jgi:hypothetical protein
MVTLCLRNDLQLNICKFVMMVMINVTVIILDIIHRSVFYLKPQHFGDWILSPPSGWTYTDGSIRKT